MIHIPGHLLDWIYRFGLDVVVSFGNQFKGTFIQKRNLQNGIHSADLG
jgi:hypothetical protein